MVKTMTEKEKAEKGILYNANYDTEILEREKSARNCVMNIIN